MSAEADTAIAQALDLLLGALRKREDGATKLTAVVFSDGGAYLTAKAGHQLTPVDAWQCGADGTWERLP